MYWKVYKDCVENVLTNEAAWIKDEADDRMYFTDNVKCDETIMLALLVMN